MAEKKKPEPRQEVVLLKAHTHEGQECAEGDKIQVTKGQAAWLQKHKDIA